uniref:ACT domain-containing protein n=1 Tax=Minutocellus polymorphus TaxID=265543 RepID=A0A7S0AY97_9STRA|mmetsp:Transcript_6432/g.10732  ORF Transcript_6432/g.10732 Transcript_6432/m.10732 type:complete len:444 (+) Transcript_6432:128-1459(+)
MSMSSPSPPPPTPTGGIKELDAILSTLSPELDKHEVYIFHTDPDASYGDHAKLRPVATCQEREGLTFVVPLSVLMECGSDDVGIDPAQQPHMRRITLGVHSSLEAVGLTAAVSTLLAKHEISANMIAGHHHDHLFVPANDAERAVELLIQFAEESRAATRKENDCHGESDEDAETWEGLMPLHVEKIVDHSNPIFTLPFKIGSKQISIEQDIEARRRPAFDTATAGDDVEVGGDLTEHDSRTGAVLWDGAVVAASLLERCSTDSTQKFRDQLDPRGKVVAELGCGCSAVPGQVAATLGAMRVSLTDLNCIVDADILRRNIDRNGLSDDVELFPHKWGGPIPAELSDVQLILAADCIYDLSLVEPLLSSISNIMVAAKANGNICVALVTFDTSIGRHKAYAMFEQEAHARFESVEFLEGDDISREHLATDSVKAYILSGLKFRD